MVAILSYKDKKYHIIHPNPDRYPQMGEIEEHIVRTMTLAEKNIRGNYLPLDAYNVGNVSPQERPESSQVAPISSRSHLKRGLKRRKPVEQTHIPSIEARKSGLAEGTWQWYQAIARSPLFTLGKPLIKSGSSLSWACSDARLSASEGKLLNVDKDMLVVVTSPGPERFECSCTIFRNHSRCVHIEYARNNYSMLSRQEFHEPGNVFRVTRNNGKSLACYCCDRALVRVISETPTRVRFKCDTHQLSDCHHVRKVFEKFASEKLFQEGREEDTDEDEDGEEDLYRPLSSFDIWLENFGKSNAIKFPYEDEIRKGVLERLEYGFADSGCSPPGIRPLQALMPRAPERCFCGLSYTEEGIFEMKDVTVYLRAPHCSRKIPCYSIRCPSGNNNCTIHYTGMHDGLWRVSKNAVVELDILVSSVRQFIKQSGPSLHSIWETIQDRYLHYGKESHGGFIHGNTFRMAFYNVCKALNTHEDSIDKVFSEKPEMKPPNPMVCPICKDSPRVLICDGTTMTIRKKLCHAKPFTNVSNPNITLWRRHDKNVRCYFGSEPTDPKISANTRKQRDMLMGSYLRVGRSSKGLLDLFGEWILKDFEGQGPFEYFDVMMKTAAVWHLDGFLGWVHASKLHGSLGIRAKESIVTFLEHLSTMDAVSSYVPYNVAKKLESYLNGESVIPIQALREFGFVLERLFGGIAHDGTVIVPEEWKSMLNRLVSRSKMIYEYRRERRNPLDNNKDPNRDRELGEEIPEEERKPSVVSGEYLDSGILSGLPRIRQRPRYQADNASDGSQRDKPKPSKPSRECTHAFGDSCSRTGGVFTCLCEHGIAYASWVIKSSEGRNDPFTFMTCFLKRAPSVVVYDFACGLMEYCLNRAPDYFKNCRFVVDKFHERNHQGCSEALRMVQFYSSGEVAPPNTQLCEQINKHMKRYKKTLQNMKQYAFMTMLRSILETWNVNKYALLIKGGTASDTAAKINYNGSCRQDVHLMAIPEHLY